MQKESNSSKVLGKLFEMNCFSKSNYYILSVNTNTKQLYFQLQKLFTDKRLCHGNNLCTLIRKNLHGPLRKKIYIPNLSRFIDDIFFIWTGSKTDLENFLNELNTKHPSIKFEYEISKERISFLDPKYTLKTTNYIPKYLERKQTAKSFLKLTQSIQNR